MDPPFFRLRRLLGIAAKTGMLLVPASFYVAHKYRPRSSLDKDFHEGLFEIEKAPTNPVEKFLYGVARQVAVLTTANFFYYLLHGTQRVDMVDIDKLHKFIDNE
jgi:hypothetical protein